MLGEGSIMAIVSSASQLTNTLVGFGTQWALIDKQQAQKLPNNIYNLNIPNAPKSGLDLNILVVGLILLLLVFALIFLTVKII